MDEIDRQFYLLMIQLENSLAFSVQDTYEIPMFVNMAVEVDY
ncbi:hypothetical protein SEA_DEKHOCKEY33_96 [Gordonia phage DekHockey33]|nr:hypothetical protein SEA_EPSOCAMISIO_92 [Gordonia phage Epsocamisio]QWS67875.1 hypothetical protein SEA_DEKHOCKEY33_96 [Gordonia phage DekHockey33]